MACSGALLAPANCVGRRTARTPGPPSLDLPVPTAPHAARGLGTVQGGTIATRHLYIPGRLCFVPPGMLMKPLRLPLLLATLMFLVVQLQPCHNSPHHHAAASTKIHQHAADRADAVWLRCTRLKTPSLHRVCRCWPACIHTAAHDAHAVISARVCGCGCGMHPAVHCWHVAPAHTHARGGLGPRKGGGRVDMGAA